MPELAELRLTADFINGVARGKSFTHTEKNQEHKGLPLPPLSSPFTIQAKSRGKELMLELTESDGQLTQVLMGMGMAGYFDWVGVGQPLPKHAHLLFVGDQGTLCFVDVRRFGKWRVALGWSPDRGPDPTTEWEAFVLNAYLMAAGRKGKLPIHLALMDQSIFNGVGNYLRAEILYRMPDLSPFTPLAETVNHPELFELCRTIPLMAYKLGGGQLKDWKSPTGEDPAGFRDFIKCYGKGIAFKDRGGRTFWMDPKWRQAAIDYFNGEA